MVWFKNRRVKLRTEMIKRNLSKKKPVAGQLYNNFSQAAISATTANGGELCGYSEGSIPGAASGLYSGNTQKPIAIWSSSHSQLHLPASTEVTALYDDDPGKMSEGHASAHSSVQWKDTLPDLKGDLHLFLEEQVYSKLDQSEDAQATAPWISTASCMSGVNIKALGSANQMILQDQLEVESRLDDLMEIIAEERFPAAPELNSTQSHYFC